MQNQSRHGRELGWAGRLPAKKVLNVVVGSKSVGWNVGGRFRFRRSCTPHFGLSVFSCSARLPSVSVLFLSARKCPPTHHVIEKKSIFLRAQNRASATCNDEDVWVVLTNVPWIWYKMRCHRQDEETETVRSTICMDIPKKTWELDLLLRRLGRYIVPTW